MEKVIKDGKVAVLISPGFGAGWYTWNQEETTPFEPKVVEMVLAGKQEELTDNWCEENLGKNLYCGGAYNLKVVWLPEGTRFSINEYDGSESLYIDSELEFTA